MVNNYPAEDYPLPKTHLRVLTTDAFDYEEARIATGFTPTEFNALPGDPCWLTENSAYPMSKADVVMYHYYKKLLEAIITHDAYKRT